MSIRTTKIFIGTLVLIGSLSSVTTNAFSQGSPLDLIGFGRPNEAWNAHIDGIGGGGVAMTDHRTVNGPNPAALSWLDRARLETELHFDFTQSTQTGFGDGRNQNLHFGGFTFGSPLGGGAKFGLSLGFNPLTDASAIFNDGDSAITHQYRSEGGVSEGFIGFAGRVHPGVAMGAKFGVLFGNIRHLSQVNFADPTVVASDFERDYAMSGLRGTFGMTLVGDSLAQSLSGITLAFSMTTGSNLKVSQRTIVTPINSTLDTTVESSGVGSYPGSFAAGLGIRLSLRYNLLGDLAIQDFSSGYLYAPQAIIGDPLLGPSTRYSVGIERIPNMANEFGITGFWDRLGLRLGASYYQLPFRPANSKVNAIAVSAGIGIPISYEGLLDLSITAGQRNPQNASAAPKDFFLRVGATVSLSERWFVPTRTNE
jgi:hypothetical protein